MESPFNENQALQQEANQPSDQVKERQRNKKMERMKEALEEMRTKIDLCNQKIKEKHAKVKELIVQKNKIEAKKELQFLKAYQEQLAQRENLAVLLEKVMVQLEFSFDKSIPLDFLKDENEKTQEFLKSFLIDKEEMDERNKENERILNDIAAGDEQEKEIEELSQRLQQQQAPDERIDRDDTKPQAESDIQPTNTNIETQDKEMEESIEDLMKKAVFYS